MKIENDTEICRECGELNNDGLSCFDMLASIIGWEYEDIELQKLHFVTVACFNLQHPAKFTRESVEGLKLSLKEHLNDDLPVKVIRLRNAKRYNGKSKVLRNKEGIKIVMKRWSMTVADVYKNNDPEGAVERVKEWAEVVMKEVE